jgi:preprotein translocase subunit SecG
MFGGSMGGGLGGSTAMEKNLDRITIVTALVFTITTILLILRLK